ncbi:glutathione synthetase [Arenicella chitinivorans]|uniref:Glutathione synthetase n=1 Tax=Arenicella chitinivorans TaxID=1329800 RepID=A0A918RMS1_9GAMM|nr:glutathione synthase [Arenicella chitinivorans]GHA05217.1 glutathione synthetase [Arenicella chitinivorans]
MKIGVVMDPIGSINIKKDSTFEMIWQAQLLGWEVVYFEMHDLLIENGKAVGDARSVTAFQDANHWYELGETYRMALGDLDAILMRKDPPFDMEFVYATYILELAEAQGAMVVNSPQALRDCNEKTYCAWFPDVCPETLITRNARDFRRFLDTHKDVILKPLDGMGGASIFRVQQDSPNIGVIIETLTKHGTRFAMAQRYLPEITAGDKRILVVAGEAVPYSLARIPAQGETRGNLAAGGRGVAQPLSDSDFAIAKRVGPELVKRNILFAGLDVIGDRLTEINVTSPTCIKEINAEYDTNIALDLLKAIESKLH